MGTPISGETGMVYTNMLFHSALLPLLGNLRFFDSQWIQHGQTCYYWMYYMCLKDDFALCT